MVVGLSALHLKIAFLACTVTAVTAQSKAGRNTRCGNVTIPYPFGTQQGCYRNKTFLVTCNTTSKHVTPTLGNSDIKILNISLETDELLVSTPVSKDCYRPNRFQSFMSMWLQRFAMSNTNNKFNEAVRMYNISIRSYFNRSYVLDFNPCGFAFLAEDGSFNFSLQDLRNVRRRTEFPVVLNWAVDHQTCREAQKNTSSYACKQNTMCQDSESGLGYLCKCKDGFQGNPYLSHPDTACKGLKR